MMMKSRVPWRTRLKFRPLAVIGIVLVWMALWGSVSPLVLASGVLLGWAIGVVFPLPPIHWTGRLRPWAFVVLIATLLRDLVVSSARLVMLAFAPKVNLNAGIVRVDLHTDDDLYQVAVAEMISLVPGTVVVEVVRHPRRLYLHAIDLVGDDPVGRIRRMAEGVDRRVVRAFGSKEQIAAFEAALSHDPDAGAPELEDES